MSWGPIFAGWVKSNVDELDIDKLKNMASNSSNLKSKIDKSDVDKLVPVPVDLSELSDIVKDDAIKNTECNANDCMFLSCHVRVSE